MDQLKEFLRQAGKHRFWIAIGVASLLPLIAFFVGTGAMAQQEDDETKKIKAADQGAKSVLSQTIKGNEWKKVVEERTALLTSDVTKSHEKLYNRQAPLLTWPDPVASIFKEWGPKYPEGIDRSKVDEILLTYTQAYPDYVDKVYASFDPFDPETGKGIVAAPSVPALLLPEVFDEVKRPSVNDVWMAQRKLWIQATLLDVIAEVNRKAKATTWDQAPIKQLLWMEIASEAALDQRTSPDQLEDPKMILAPGQTAPDPAAKADSGLATPAAGTGGMKFVKSSNPDQYFVVPVAMELYVEQDKIPDLLVAFRNSPMSIVIKDFKWTISAKPIVKPKKGQTATAFDGAAAGAARGRGSLAGEEMGAAGGGGEMMSLDTMKGQNNAYNSKAKGGGGMGRAFGAGGNDAKAKARENSKDVKADTVKRLQDKKKGTDKSKDKDKKDDEEIQTAANPYYNVVQVTIRGQARFYEAPPKSAEAPKAETPGAEPDAKGEAPKVDAKDALKADAPKADAKDAPKADAPKDDAKPDAPKADAPKDAPKADAPKGDAKPDAPKDTPKTDAPKADAPKADAPKADAPKGDAPKGDGDAPKDAPKGDADKPKA